MTQPQLPNRPLGTTGLTVSCLGLGTVKFGRTEGLKYPVAKSLPSAQQLSRLLDQARGLGINLLDTAPAYGTSEERLGQLLSERHRWRICTKVGETFSGSRSTFDFSAAALQRSVERSLKALQTDYLDIVLVHSSGADEEVLTTQQPLATLIELRDAGKVRCIGFSGKTLAGGRMALKLGAEVLMVTLNAHERSEEPLLADAATAGAGVLVKKPLASGRGHPDQLPAIANLAGVTSLVVGTTNPDHLAANALAISKAAP